MWRWNASRSTNELSTFRLCSFVFSEFHKRMSRQWHGTRCSFTKKRFRLSEPKDLTSDLYSQPMIGLVNRCRGAVRWQARWYAECSGVTTAYIMVNLTGCRSWSVLREDIVVRAETDYVRASWTSGRAEKPSSSTDNNLRYNFWMRGITGVIDEDGCTRSTYPFSFAAGCVKSTGYRTGTSRSRWKFRI